MPRLLLDALCDSAPLAVGKLPSPPPLGPDASHEAQAAEKRQPNAQQSPRPVPPAGGFCCSPGELVGALPYWQDCGEDASPLPR